MSVITALYTLLIGPLELFFEVLYSQVNRILDNPGLSIVFLSLAMNFLVLPLYKRADAMQEEERETDKKLSPTVKHIKKVFSGDERFMILQTFYRENNYKPTDALKGSVSLLLEIPFFMAAYNFLSGLPILHGASFGPIQNLGAPDGLLVIGGIAINVLPILMTAINLVSSAIYTKGSSIKSKMQLYVMAGLFLILLYDSPSGLVFYWTLNNLFSLFKNIFMKLPNPKKVFCWMTSAVGAAALAFLVVTHPMPTAKSQFLLCCMTLMLQLPLVIFCLSRRFRKGEVKMLSLKDRKTFWIGGIFMTVLTGMFIPAGVISASPEEFINTATGTSPLIYILSATLTAAGFFLIWFGIFYLLANDSGRKWMSWGMSTLCVVALVDFMFFGRNYGNMSANLVFDMPPVYTRKLLNLVVVAAVAAVIWILLKKKQEFFRFAVLTATLAAIALSVFNMTQVNGVTVEKTDKIEQMSQAKPVIPLSRQGRNVIVLMLDRGISAYVPYIMNEKPELKDQFDGFTYYPNTVSFGGHTNFGAPALFGGYEYTPEEMNKRNLESLESKTNEALKVMPVSFLNAGYEVTVCDPPCAGYDWIPDLTIYDEYPEINTFNSMRAVLSDPDDSGETISSNRNTGRKFFCYSVFKITPVIGQRFVYDNGKYNHFGKSACQHMIGFSKAEGRNAHFNESYAVLSELRNLTRIEDSSENTFLMLTNDTTHEPTLLQKPEYVPEEFVDNEAFDQKDCYNVNGTILKMETNHQIKHYHVNMAAFLRLGEWFDYLREQDVFHNTRIILVADHGIKLFQLDGTKMFEQLDEDIMNYNPLLMVKDFNAAGFTVNETFMTNADTSMLAMKGLIEHPVNPFTSHEIDNCAKAVSACKILLSHEYDIEKNNGNTFFSDHWGCVHDNIFDCNNWEYLGVK